MVHEGEAPVRGRGGAGGERAAKRAALKERAGELYRRAILEAAERVFQSRRFDGAKMADIAREAGLAAGTLYNYFDSKESIFRSLLELRGDEVLASLDEISAAGLPPLAWLEALVTAGLTFMEEHRVIHEILIQLGARPEADLPEMCGPGAEARRGRYLAHFERALRALAATGALRKDVPIADLVALLTGIIHGLMGPWLAARRKTGLARKAPLLLDLFLHGVGAP